MTNDMYCPDQLARCIEVIETAIWAIDNNKSWSDWYKQTNTTIGALVKVPTPKIITLDAEILRAAEEQTKYADLAKANSTDETRYQWMHSTYTTEKAVRAKRVRKYEFIRYNKR